MMTSRTPYDTHLGQVINLAKFDAFALLIFIEVKTDRQTDRFVL